MQEFTAIQDDPSSASSYIAERRNWPPIVVFAFRFLFCYLVLYLVYLLNELCFFITFLPTGKAPPEVFSRLWHVVVPWFGKHVLNLNTDISTTGNSSGDTMYDFVLVLFNLFVSAVVAAGWSLLDRKRKEYRVLNQWLRLGVQLFLSAMMFAYGTNKLIPLQFGTLKWDQMVRPVGEMTPITLLWTFMAASPLYTIFAGFTEVLGGVLVLFRRTVTLGALICFAAMCNVLALNLGYDVPVKLQTFQFALLALFLLIPDFQRLSDFFLLDRAAERRREVPLSNRVHIDRMVRYTVPVLGVLFLGWFLAFSYRSYEQRETELAQRGPLYGVWDIEQFTVEETRPGTLFTERLQENMHIRPGHDVWKRLLFGSKNNLTIQLDGTMDLVVPRLDEKRGLLTISDEADPIWICKLKYERPDPTNLLLHGEVNGLPVMMKLHREDDERFALTSRGFHLISEQAFFN